MATPRVSILLPVFDGVRFLEPCLRSVARQELREWECVVVDDGSRDGSGELARSFARRDSRFRVVSRPHRGLVAALNAGLEQCRAPLVARMDADDVMHRERLAVQAAALDAEAALDAVGCRVRLFPRVALGAGMRAYERWLNGIDSPERVRAEAFVECPVAHPTLLIRREALRGLRYRDRDWPEDYDLVLRLLARDGRIRVLARRLLSWRHRPQRLSQVSPTYTPPRFTACKAAFLAEGFLSGGRHYVLWGYGGTGRALRGALDAHGKEPSAIVEVHPGRLGNRIHGAPVVPPEDLARLRGQPLVVSVAGAGPRGVIRDALARMGFRETVDYVCAA